MGVWEFECRGGGHRQALCTSREAQWEDPSGQTGLIQVEDEGPNLRSAASPSAGVSCPRGPHRTHLKARHISPHVVVDG